MTTITTRTVTTLTTEDMPFTADLDFTPVDWIEPVVTFEDDVYTVAYAVQDWDASPFEWNDVRFFQGDIRRLSQTRNPEDVLAMPHVFAVEVYEHGQVRYALTGEATAVDREWDVTPVGLIGLPEGYDDPEAAARGWLDEYTSWCNGDVYGIVRQTYTATGEVKDETDAVYGFIGTENAEAIVKDVYAYM